MQSDSYNLMCMEKTTNPGQKIILSPIFVNSILSHAAMNDQIFVVIANDTKDNPKPIPTTAVVVNMQNIVQTKHEVDTIVTLKQNNIQKSKQIKYQIYPYIKMDGLNIKLDTAGQISASCNKIKAALGPFCLTPSCWVMTLDTTNFAHGEGLVNLTSSICAMMQAAQSITDISAQRNILSRILSILTE